MNPSKTDENCGSFIGISYKSRGVVPSWQKPQSLAQAWQAVTQNMQLSEVRPKGPKGPKLSFLEQDLAPPLWAVSSSSRLNKAGTEPKRRRWGKVAHSSVLTEFHSTQYTKIPEVI